MKNAEDVIYLCSCVLNGATPDKEKIENMDLDAAYTFAARHMLAALVATAVESAGYRDGTSSAIIARALKATILFDVKRKETLETLERAGIWYMPVKGAVLKDLYPRYGVREMSDNDILFDAERRGGRQRTDGKERIRDRSVRKYQSGRLLPKKRRSL